MTIRKTRKKGRGRAFWRRILHVYINSWRVFRSHWKPLLVAALIVFTPAAVLETAGTILTEGGLEGVPFRAILIVLATSGANMLAYQMFKGVATNASVQWRKDETRLSVRGVFEKLPYVSLVAADVVITFGSAIGLVLLIVPGVVFATWFSMAPVLIELEERRLWSAMRRSFQIVRGNFLIALTLILITYLIVYGIEESLKAGIHGALDGVWDGELVNGTVAALVTSVLIKPVSALATVELTQDIIARRRAAGLEPAEAQA